MEDKNSKIALVTGASGGIGRASAIALAQKGVKVILHYHKNLEAVNSTFSLLEGNGHIIIQANLADEVETERFAKEIISNYKIDILVNNAGIFEILDIYESDFQDWKMHWMKTINTNLIGPALLSYFISRQMAENNGGRIINISSRGAFRGEPMAMAYGASKAGLNAFGQSMAQSMAKDKVLVYTIAPGFVDTEMSASALLGPFRDEFMNQSPLGRVAQAEEIANMMKYCALEAPEFMTGCIIDVNGASYLRT